MNVYQEIINYQKLSLEILSVSNKPIPRFDYFYSILSGIKNYSGCDGVELWLGTSGKFSIFSINDSGEFDNRAISLYKKNKKSLQDFKANSFLDLVRHKLLIGEFDPKQPFFNSQGSFWCGGKTNSVNDIKKYKGTLYKDEHLDIPSDSFALIPIYIDQKLFGFIQLMCKQKDFFNKEKIILFEGIASSLGIALINKRVQRALQERVKELSCMYDIAKVSENENLSTKEMLQQIANLIPPAWQFPEITIGQIYLDGKRISSAKSVKIQNSQSADILINGRKRGKVEAIYTVKKPHLDEGPFLIEERKLINAIANQIGLIVERKEAEENKSALEEQIRHADRLATIGQLAAGVAHELNEPLGNILGFAQLLAKNPHLQTQAVKDIDKIIKASLHAREIIKKLMLFSRQTPPKRGKVNLNELVKEGLYLFEARCNKSDIILTRNLIRDIPEIEGDAGQLNQVLVNLVVNSIQAMPNGGELTISTDFDQESVLLIIEDTGLGVNEDIKSKVFIPFFTTKDIDEGTGLGLAVVHGIVLSHKGSIEFESQSGIGTRFQIKFPICNTN